MLAPEAGTLSVCRGSNVQAGGVIQQAEVRPRPLQHVLPR